MTPSRNILAQAIKAGGEIRTRMDGWFNTLTGLGTVRDKRMGAQFAAGAVLQPEECEDLFHHDDLANTIVSAVPHDALRQGFLVKRAVEEELGEDAEVGEVQEDSVTLDKRLRELQVTEKVREAMVWGRCMGGGFILLGVKGGGRPNTPLDDSKVQAVEFLTVLDRRDLTPATWYQDANKDKYGEVETYYLNPISSGPFPSFVPQAQVHETRLVKFGGALTSRRKKQQNGGWDHSVLQRLVDKLRDANSNWDSVVTMFQDMSQAVYKLQGLIEAIAGGDEEALQARMALTDKLRSITKAIILDAENEDFTLVERGTMTGVGDLVDRTWLRLSAAARMPVTILMGQAPAGLNATGATDLRWWYDTVRTSQEMEIKPRLVRIIRLVAKGLFPGMDPESWDVEFPSLWMLTPQEEADLRSKVADTDTKYITAMVVLPEEITLSRFGRGKYSTDYVVDLDARKQALQVELERIADPPDPLEMAQAMAGGALPPGGPPDPEDPEDPELQPDPEE